MEKEEFEPGIYDISNDRYQAAKGLSRSQLWTFKHLPYKYWYQYLSGQYEEPLGSESFLLGNLLHTLLLEPKKFEDQFFIMPKINRKTKQGKIDYAEAMVCAHGKTLIKPELLATANAMVDALMDRDISLDICQGAKIEQSIFWRDERTGILCKARPDIWNHPLMADLKSTEDASYRGFQLSACKYGYFLQAAMLYEASKSLGIPFEKFVFMCVEKKAPYSVGFYMVDDEALQFGLDLFYSLLQKYAECLEKNDWPDYGIQMLMIPKYATMEAGNE
jgi:exodeoxyribonuclease VIII